MAIVVLVFTMYFQLENNLFSSYRDLQDKLNEMRGGPGNSDSVISGSLA